MDVKTILSKFVINLNIDLVQEIESSLKILIISRIQTSDVLINIAEKKEFVSRRNEYLEVTGLCQIRKSIHLL